MKRVFRFAWVGILTALCLSGAIAVRSHLSHPRIEPVATVLPTAEVEWEPLNPARGEQSPQAGTLWGDRTGPGPAGFLLKPVDGFRSPPHIHNVAYRGVVISGTLHNDDPNAEDMFMPVGSFWTQPAGGIHITAAQGNDALAYIEVEDNFGVLPADQAFDSAEKPINVDVSNLIWLDASSTDWLEQPPLREGRESPKIAFLWGNFQGTSEPLFKGTLLKLPAGFAATLQNEGSNFRAVVIQGQPQHQVLGQTSLKTLEPGSYFSAPGKLVSQIISDSENQTMLYIRTDGRFHIAPA